MAGSLAAGSGGSGGSSARRRRRHKAPIADINMTPFIDVMLCLLIIFMVAAPLLTSGVTLDLPQSAAGVVAAFAAQAAVALELAARRADAEQLTVFEDRDRIARDLHDLVIQRLYATGMSLEGMMPMISRREVSDRVRNAVDAMDDTIRDIRATIFALQSRGRASVPRMRADIVALADEMAEMLGFPPALRLGSGLDSRASGELSEQVLAVLREALSNAARHAGASRVDVMVDTDAAGILTVLVRDNGRGMQETSRRSGLANMAERAEKLGGQLRVSPAEGGGTELEWKVPVPPEAAGGADDELRPSPQGKYPLLPGSYLWSAGSPNTRAA